MISNPPVRPPRSELAFSLVELLAVILILTVLVGLAASLFGRSDATLLRTGADRLAASIEQARTSAITRRKPVALAILEPGRGGFNDAACRIGLFELDEEPRDGAASGTLLQRWQALPEGLALFGGEVDSLANLRDAAAIRLSWKGGSESAEVPVLVFTPRGGLAYPEGSESVVVTIGTGTYRDGEPARTGKSGTRTIRVGRVVARAWNLDA